MSNSFNLLYSKKVLEHVKNPQNLGEMKDANGISTVGNPVCGDIMRFFIKVEKKNGREIIKDIKFQTLGCGAAIATSSMMTVLAKGKTLDEALKITKIVLAEALGGLPAAKMHCSVLADEALKKAIENYQASKK